jgi:hypothetical protein
MSLKCDNFCYAGSITWQKNNFCNIMAPPPTLLKQWEEGDHYISKYNNACNYIF